MRTWLLTSTTYGTWLPGDRRGSIASVRDVRDHDQPTRFRLEHDSPHEAYEAAMPGLERASKLLLKNSPITFRRQHAELLLEQFQETATYRGWSVLAIAIMFNHFHIVVEVAADPEPHKILADFKAYGSRRLNRAFGVPASGTWWTSAGSTRKLPHDRAVKAAINYVRYRQPNPLVVWPSEKRENRGELGKIGGEPGA